MASLRIAATQLSGLFLVLLLFSTGGCGRSSGASGGEIFSSQDGGSNDPVPVEIVAIGTGPIQEVLRFSANLEAETQVQVLSRAVGHVRRLLVEEGDAVKRSQVLLRLESEEQQSALKRVEVDLELARRTLEKQKRMHAEGGLSEQALETTEFEVKRLEIARTDAARALRYTTVRAPVGGTVTRRSVKRGDFVNPNQLLFEIIDFESIVARVFVPEKDMGKLKPGLGASILAQASGERLHDGTVDLIAPVVDPRSGTVKVTIDLPRTEGLRPGMFVDVELVTDQHADAVLLPRRALVYDNDVPYAFKLVGDDRVERVRVVPALQNRDYVEPAQGIAAGDRVVVAGQVGLRDKARVTPKKAPEEAR
jgi:membrane fusion protein (multidrug efflux system)